MPRRGDRGLPGGDAVDGPGLGEPAFAGYVHAQIAALGAVEVADVGVQRRIERLERAVEGDREVGTDAGGGELHGHRCAAEVVAVDAQVAEPGRVDVPGEHDRVGDAGVAQQPQQAGARRVVAVPLVEVGDRRERVRRVEEVREAYLARQHLLGDDVPAGPRRAQPVGEPALLLGAGERARGVGQAVLDGAEVARTAAGLVGAVLPRVEDVDPQEVAELEAAVQPVVRRAGHGGAA